MDMSRSTCDVKAIWFTITRASAKLSSTHHENHNITLNVRLRGRRALYNHQSRGRPLHSAIKLFRKDYVTSSSSLLLLLPIFDLPKIATACLFEEMSVDYLVIEPDQRI
eukprot:scaffold3263_cov128-Skeletonema_menzelii.AAC.4